MTTVRYPLAQAFQSRDGTIAAKDTFVLNGCMEKFRDKIFVRKRPGTKLRNDFGFAQDPQGVYYYNGQVYSVIGDDLFRDSGTVPSGTSASAFTQANTPSWWGRFDHMAAVFADKMWVTGGIGRFAYADIASTPDGETWSINQAAGPFGNRQGGAMVVFAGQLWVIGGFNPATNTFCNDVWSSPDGVQWTQVTNAAPFPVRGWHAAVADANGIYIIGGLGADVQNAFGDIWFSADGKQWAQVSVQGTQWGPRYNHSVLLYHNRIFVIGGNQLKNGFNQSSNEVWWSSTGGATWNLGTSAAFASGRQDMAACVYNDQMYVFGGTDDASSIYGDVYRCASLTGSSWFKVTGTPGFSPRYGARALVFRTPTALSPYHYETIWITGGFSPDGTFGEQQVWYGNLDTNLQAFYPLGPGAQDYQFASFLNGTKLLIKNQSNLWVLEAGNLTQVSDSSYPPETVPGIVTLNSFAYVATPSGEIRACTIDNPLQWASLQFTTADYGDDQNVRLFKHLNFVGVLGTYTLQFFYDAGNPAPGIPLAPYQSGNARVGCVNARSVQSVNNTTIWVGQTEDHNPGVYMLNGLLPERVSPVWVDRVLEENLDGGLYAFVTAMQGHTFYVLNFLGAGYALVLDIESGQWQPWQSGAGDFPYCYALSTLAHHGDLWFGCGRLASKVYSAEFENYDDDGVPFTLRVQTERMDGGSMQRKFWQRCTLIGDASPGAFPAIEVSDDDYVTWDRWGYVDMAQAYPYLTRGGSSRRRAYRVSQTDSNPARWLELEVVVEGGG